MMHMVHFIDISGAFGARVRHLYNNGLLHSLPLPHVRQVVAFQITDLGYTPYHLKIKYLLLKLCFFAFDFPY